MIMKLQSFITLSILTIVGAALRFYKLDFQCLWTEELFTLAMSKLPTLDIITTFDFNPPVYYLLSHIAWMMTHDIYSIRYPSVIAGILLIPCMYYLGRVYKDELTGLYCAAFTTLVFPFLYYSQYARAYELSVLLFCISLILYIKIKRGESLEIWFAVVCALNVWTHLFVIIPLSLMIIDLLFDNIKNKKWIVGIVGVSLLPFINVFVEIFKSRSISTVSYGAGIIEMIVLTPLELFNSLFLNIIFLSGLGWYIGKDKLKNNLMAIAILTIVIGIGCSAFTSFFPRYFMTVSLIFLLVAAVGCVEIVRMCKLERYEMAIMIIIIAICSWMAYPNFVSHYEIVQYTC